MKHHSDKPMETVGWHNLGKFYEPLREWLSRPFWDAMRASDRSKHSGTTRAKLNNYPRDETHLKRTL
jgi:hypothetical protein